MLRYVGIRVSLKSVPMLCFHLKIFSAKPPYTQKEEQLTAFQTSALETNSLHSLQSYEISGLFKYK
jgi:hypothetical protein